MLFQNLQSYFREQSIQRKLILINLSVTVTALVFAVITALSREYVDNRNNLLNSLQVKSKMVANNSTAALVFSDAGDAKEILSAFSESPDIQLAILFDQTNSALAIYRKPGSTNIVDTNIKIEEIKRSNFEVVDLSSSEFFLDESISFSQTIYFDFENIGYLYIQADASHLKADIISYLIYISLMAIIGLALASIILVRMSRSIVLPIANLIETMGTVMEKDDYSLRVKNYSTDEIGALSIGFNKMLAHIQVNDEKLEYELSERYKAEEHLDKLAYYDVVTNLPNRHFFQEHLKKTVQAAIEQNKKSALLFLDLDDFKNINDTLGHKMGDVLLEQSSSRLSSILRKDDHICRIGGDEFAIVIQQFENIENIILIAQKCIDVLSMPFIFESKNYFIGVSVGISICPDDATTANALLVNSDMAMYEAKMSGKNNFQFYSKKLDETYSRKYQLANDLRRAVNLNQLELYYQPQVDAQTEMIIGVEALMRWHHPEHGPVPPDEFIPLAEESGLILTLGQWLIKTSCIQGKKIVDSGLKDISVAINISGQQIKEEHFCSDIVAALEESGLEARNLKIELTESILMENTNLVIEKLQQIRQLGISIAIDDFGTGFSSMNYLKIFPISQLKIDKSFVSGLPDGEEDSAITRAIIAMAHGLGLSVVAEGVEEQAQADFLSELGCDVFQGYYYARPLSFEYFLDSVKHEKRSNEISL